MHFSIGEGYDCIREFNIEKFCRLFEIQEQQCRASLRLLDQAGYMTFIEEPDHRSRVMIIITREELYDIKGISENAEKALSSILRLYPGLFADYVYIRESEVATHASISGNQIYDAFLELSKAKIINYIPFKGLPLIYMPTSREETDTLIIGQDIYEKRRNALQRRCDAMLEYAFGRHECRVNMMLGYFGEKPACLCGKCDPCREYKKQKTVTKQEDVLNGVVNFLKTRPYGALVSAIKVNCPYSPSSVAHALNFLCNEGFVVFEDNLYKLTDSLR